MPTTDKIKEVEGKLSESETQVVELSEKNKELSAELDKIKKDAVYDKLFSNNKINKSQLYALKEGKGMLEVLSLNEGMNVEANGSDDSKEPTVELNETENIADSLVNNNKTINDLFIEIKKDKDLATQMQLQPISDLSEVITINDKIRFIKELFNGSSGDYSAAIDYFNTCKDLDEAMQFIDSNMDWDESKDGFKSFLELIYRRHIPDNL